MIVKLDHILKKKTYFVELQLGISLYEKYNKIHKSSTHMKLLHDHFFNVNPVQQYNHHSYL